MTNAPNTGLRATRGAKISKSEITKADALREYRELIKKDFLEQATPEQMERKKLLIAIINPLND